MRNTFIQRLFELAELDESIMLITGDLGFGVFDEYRKKLPKQFLNVGVAEQNMTAVATGMAMEGYTVFTYSIGNFPTFRCLEHIRNDACYHDANVKVVSIGGGFSYGSLGPSHHATEDLAVMRSLPNMTVVSPSDHWEVAEATAALVKTPGTCFLRLDKSAGAETVRPDEQFELGKIRQVRAGDDVTFIVTGGIMEEVQAAAERLSNKGIEACVLSVHTLKPFDKNTIAKMVHEKSRIITVEEHTIHGGLGSIVAETLLDEGIIPGSFRRMAFRDGFSSIVGCQKYLRQRYGLDADSIANTALEVLNG